MRAPFFFLKVAGEREEEEEENYSSLVYFSSAYQFLSPPPVSILIFLAELLERERERSSISSIFSDLLSSPEKREREREREIEPARKLKILSSHFSFFPLLSHSRGESWV